MENKFNNGVGALNADGAGASGNARHGGANSDMKPSAESSALDGGFRRRMKGPGN